MKTFKESLVWIQSSKRTLCRFETKLQSKKGQASLEYILLVILISGAAFAFASTMNEKVFGEGLRQLPQSIKTNGNLLSQQR